MKFAILTGNIGSGKSTVAAELRKMGYPVINSDRMLKDIYLTDPGVRGAVTALWGPDAIEPLVGLSSTVRNEALDDMVVYRWLESITCGPMDLALGRVFWNLAGSPDVSGKGHGRGIAFIETAVMSDWIFGGMAMTRKMEHAYTFRVYCLSTEARIDRVVERYQRSHRLETEQYGFFVDPQEVYDKNRKVLSEYRDMVVRTDHLQDIVNGRWYETHDGHPKPMDMLNECEDHPARIAAEIDLVVSK